MPPLSKTWLRLKLRKDNGENTKTITAPDLLPDPLSPLQYSWPAHPRDPDPINVSALHPDDSISATLPPPGYDEQGTTAFLRVGLPRGHEIRVLEVLNRVMSDLYEGLEYRGDDRKTVATIAAAVRAGTLSAVVTVRRAFFQRDMGELEQDVDEACHEAINAVIATTVAAQKAGQRAALVIGATIGTANFITLAAHRAAKSNHEILMPHIVATQLASASQSMAASISARISMGNLVLTDIPLPPRAEFLPKS
ncbi:hypothetical protein GQ53DRAFT_850263 [Thozetella sp. PMI_491]|nr:hypothetical protein GQ53DRAFT_850263 [Thozetella sp. PMI_491]